MYKIDEFIHKLKHVPDPVFKGGNCSVCECGNVFGLQRWSITDKVENYRIATIDLESPATGNILSFEKIMEDIDKEFWFETMIFNTETGEPLPFQMRYETKDEAIKSHEFIIKNINRIILDPNKYPRSIFAQMVDMYKQ